MGMQNPVVGEQLDKLSEEFPEGTPFFLEGIRFVESNTQNYGKGEMVVVRVRGAKRELGIWGAYLLTQAKSVGSDDLNKWYVVDRIVVPGFGKQGRPVKAFVPTDPPTMAPPVASEDPAPPATLA
jgi:hypothetical protein